MRSWVSFFTFSLCFSPVLEIGRLGKVGKRSELRQAGEPPLEVKCWIHFSKDEQYKFQSWTLRFLLFLMGWASVLVIYTAICVGNSFTVHATYIYVHNNLDCPKFKKLSCCRWSIAPKSCSSCLSYVIVPSLSGLNSLHGYYATSIGETSSLF